MIIIIMIIIYPFMRLVRGPMVHTNVCTCTMKFMIYKRVSLFGGLTMYASLLLPCFHLKIKALGVHSSGESYETKQTPVDNTLFCCLQKLK